MSVYLAADIGTTGCRSILFDGNLRMLSESYREYGLTVDNEKGWVEQDASDWWELLIKTAKEAEEKAGISGRDIDAIGISSQGITVVPVDERLEPLRGAISWLDVRAGKQAELMEKAMGSKRIAEITGKRIDEVYTLPKIVWLREEMPEIYQKTHKMLMPMDFIAAKLTGRCATDHSMASGTLMYNIRKGVWDREILDCFGVDESILPELVRSGEPIGRVTRGAAQALGLREDCIVAAGAQDQKCAALGAGIGQGTVTVSIGTAGAVCALKEVGRAEDAKVGLSAYINENTWIAEGVINTAGVCLKWTRDNLFAGEGYDVINKEAGDAYEAGTDVMFYPYMSGPSSPDYYKNAEGCFYGVNLGAKRGDMALAVMEGVAFQVKIIMEAMDVNAGRLVFFGGGAKSPVWRRVMADITGMEVEVPETVETACVGAAMLAGMAAGEYARDKQPPAAAAVFPPSEKQRAYAEKYRRYRDIEKKLWKTER